MKTLFFTLLFLVSIVEAKPKQKPKLTDPDTAASKKHHDLGVKLYTQGNYEEALKEIEIARMIKPAPDIDYNLALCHERLEAWEKAADAYARYAKAIPPGKEADLAKARADDLRNRAKQIATPPPPPPHLIPETKPMPDTTPVLKPVTPLPSPALPEKTPLVKRWWFWTSLGGGLALVLGVGLGVGLTQNQNHLHTTDGQYTVHFP